MIDIIKDIVPEHQHSVTYDMGDPLNYPKKETVPLFAYSHKFAVPGNLYDKGVTGYVRLINDRFDKELNWFVIKKMLESPKSTQVIEEIELDEFSINSIIKLLLKYFPYRTDTMRIICSSDTWRILDKASMSDGSMYGSFLLNHTMLSVPVDTDDIPKDEIWLIDLASWYLPMTRPSNNVEFSTKYQQYTYTRTYKIGKPVCVGDRLIRVKLITTTKEDSEIMLVFNLLEKMMLPPKVSNSAPFGVVIPTGESVWLTRNPDDDLRVINKVASVKEQRVIPQMFNPGMPIIPGNKKKNKK
jgi:hypothetical protein